MSRRSPTGFVFSVAAEVIAVVFIVSVLPRVDLRRSAGASSTSYEHITPPNDAPSLLTSVPSWPIAAERPRETSTHETSYYQQRSQPADLPRSSRDLPTREPPPLITVDPARPDYVEQRLDRASQGLVNTVGNYVSQAANDLLSAPPPAAAPQPLDLQRTYAPSVSRLPSAVPSLVPTLATTPPTAGSFPTQPQSHPPRQPRPWVRY